MIMSEEIRSRLNNLKREKTGRVAFGIREILSNRSFDGAADMAVNVLLDRCDGSIKDILEKPAFDCVAQIGLPVNTLPYGVATDRVFPTLVATCNKKGNLCKTLDEIKLHAFRYCDEGVDSVREIVLLTNNWDDNEFVKDYEEDLFAINQKYGVKFVSILITSYDAHELVCFG